MNPCVREKEEKKCCCIIERPTARNPFTTWSPSPNAEALASGKIFRVLSHLLRDARASSVGPVTFRAHVRGDRVWSVGKILFDRKSVSIRLRRAIFRWKILLEFVIYVKNCDLRKSMNGINSVFVEVYIVLILSITKNLILVIILFSVQEIRAYIILQHCWRYSRGNFYRV